MTIEPIKRILVYRCGAIGDTIVSVPAIDAIRRRFDGASLALMTAVGEEHLLGRRGPPRIWVVRQLRDISVVRAIEPAVAVGSPPAGQAPAGGLSDLPEQRQEFTNEAVAGSIVFSLGWCAPLYLVSFG